jgi:glutamyl/glutaminyl-tRNA synthetase
MVAWLGMNWVKPGQGWWSVGLFLGHGLAIEYFLLTAYTMSHPVSGYSPYKVTYASDYFDQLYAWAVELIHR